MADRIFGAPQQPQATSGSFYSTVKAASDAGALQAQATAGAVDNVLGALRGALEMKARREEKLMDALLARDLEQQRQAARINLAEYEQAQYNQRAEADLSFRRETETARLGQQKYRDETGRMQESRLTKQYEDDAQLRDLQRQRAEIGLDLDLERLQENRAEHLQMKQAEEQKALVREAFTRFVEKDALGGLRPGVAREVRDMIADLPGYETADDPGVADMAVMEAIKMLQEHGKLREQQQKPAMDRQKRLEDIRLKIVTANPHLSGDEIEAAVRKVVGPGGAAGGGQGKRRPSGKQPGQAQAPAGAQAQPVNGASPGIEQLVDRFDRGLLGREEMNALPDDVKAEFERIMQARYEQRTQEDETYQYDRSTTAGQVMGRLSQWER